MSAQGALARCMADGECLENLVCLQLCNGKPDESACQVRLHLDALEKGGNCCLLWCLCGVQRALLPKSGHSGKARRVRSGQAVYWQICTLGACKAGEQHGYAHL